MKKDKFLQYSPGQTNSFSKGSFLIFFGGSISNESSNNRTFLLFIRGELTNIVTYVLKLTLSLLFKDELIRGRREGFFSVVCFSKGVTPLKEVIKELTFLEV